MSIIFGIRKPVGAPVSEQELLHLARATERYALDGMAFSVAGRIGMGFQPCYTHSRSKLETSPANDAQGNLLVFDGRLDNYQDLCQELQLDEISTPDSQIVLGAFHRWSEGCFSRFIGDWALALWSAKDQLLYLARDHAGTRTLYFENKNGTLFWSTYLDNFFANPRSIEVDEDYAACYLAAQPIRDLTPYKGIRAVLPAHYLIAREDTLATAPHWQWMSQATIRYNSDKEYEEHFLALLGQSVARRNEPSTPILAELSGGMDSTAIICMSDRAHRVRAQSADLLDTISFYDDSEPSWNEKPYFSAVERYRGKTGVHIQTSFVDRTFEPHDPSNGCYFLPGADSSTIERERTIQAAIGERGYRSILSGIGGDEVLGGVPSPKPELADYLVTGNWAQLLNQAVRWCVADRSPLFKILIDGAKYTCDLYRQPRLDGKSIPPWIAYRLQSGCAALIKGGVLSGRRLGLNPSSITNGLAWWSIMETLPHAYPGLTSRPEYRYPYLDKQLVDYLFSIPIEQLVRPGRRRSLMRRALKNIVPEEILERRRKAYLIRGPLVAMQNARKKIDILFADAFICDKGFVDPAKLRAALDLIEKGSNARWWQALTRAIVFELWLKGLDPSRHTNSQGVPSRQILLSNIGANKIRTIWVAS